MLFIINKIKVPLNFSLTGSEVDCTTNTFYSNCFINFNKTSIFKSNYFCFSQWQSIPSVLVVKATFMLQQNLTFYFNHFISTIFNNLFTSLIQPTSYQEHLLLLLILYQSIFSNVLSYQHRITSYKKNFSYNSLNLFHHNYKLQFQQLIFISSPPVHLPNMLNVQLLPFLKQIFILTKFLYVFSLDGFGS